MAQGAAGPLAFKLPRPLTVTGEQTTQVELVPRRAGLKARRVTVFAAANDRSDDFTETAATDCYGFEPDAEQIHQALEVDGGGVTLPPGPLRVMRRTDAGLVLDREQPGVVDLGGDAIRIVTGVATQVTGARTQRSCEGDDTGRSLTEEIEVRVDNRGKVAVDVVVREHLFRWRNWKLVAEDVKGVAVGPQTREYRLRLPPGGSRTVSYTVEYAW